MSAEGQPRDDALAGRALGLLARGLLRAPRATLLLGLLLAVLCMLLAGLHLGYRTNRIDLLNPQSAYNQRWLAFREEFGSDDDAIVIFQSTHRDTLLAAIDQTAAVLAEFPDDFHSILSRIDVEPLRRKALHYLTPDDLQRVARGIEQVGETLAGNWARLELSSQLVEWERQVQWLRQTGDAPAAQPEFHRLGLHLQHLLSAVGTALDGNGQHATQLVPGLFDVPEHPLNQLAGDHDGHLLLDQGRTGLLLVRFKQTEPSSQLVHGSAAIERLRTVVTEQRPQFPDVSIGLTGLPVLEHDEMQTSQQDMYLASAISLLGVAALFVAGFGGIRLPLLTVAALMVAMAWSLGYTTLSVGHLNILSISFGVILIGLGIDYGIHYVSRYAQLRDAGVPCADALVSSLRDVGPGILTGGITTATAFFSAALTEFTGVVELGVIAGGGILLCIVAMITLLPVMIRLTEREGSTWRPARPLPFAILCTPVLWTPRLWIWGMVVVTLGLGVGLPQLTFDHNLLNLQAKDLESVTWEHRLLDSGEHSVWFAVSMAGTRQQLEQRKRRFERLPTVQRTEEILSLVPTADTDRTRMIAHIQQRLGQLPDAVPTLPVAPREVFLDALARVTAVLHTGSSPWPDDCRRLAADVDMHLRHADWPQAQHRLGAVQQQLATEMLAQLTTLRQAADPAAPTFDELPAPLRDRFIGQSGRFLLRVYARGNIWDMDALSAFVRDVEKVDPQITGHPIQTYYSSRQMLTSYLHAAVYSLLAVAIVLMLDFHSIRIALLAMLPMACGIVQMFGLLGWLGIPLNPANLIVLPLILGIGIDDGVHVMHDYLRTTGRYRIGNSTATAVILTSATTMVGFGSMMIAHHQGLRSLGQVLTLGVGCCLLTSLVALPAVLAVLSANRAAAPPEVPRAEPPAPHFPHRRSHRPRYDFSQPVILRSPRRIEPPPED